MAILDTNGEMFPEGKYTFRVADVPLQVDIKGYVAWHWSFDTDTDEGPRTYNERFMVWTLAPLARALGFKEVTPGRFSWEPPDALGRSVNATIKHVTLEKGASAGKTVARMTDIQPVGKLPDYSKVAPAMAAQAPGKAKAVQDDVPF